MTTAILAELPRGTLVELNRANGERARGLVLDDTLYCSDDAVLVLHAGLILDDWPWDTEVRVIGGSDDFEELMEGCAR